MEATPERQAHKEKIRAALARKRRPKPAARASERPRPEPDTPVPAGSAQARLWFLEQLQPGQAAYTVATRLRLDGPLDPKLLERAYDQLMGRHQALRTRLRYDGEALMAHIEPAHIGMGKVTLIEPVDASQEAVEQQIKQLASQPFDLAQELPSRAWLLRVSAEQHWFVHAAHHSATDGWSRTLFMRELAELYSAAVSDRAPTLPQLDAHYSDFVRWQNDQLSAQRLESLQSYWAETLGGAPEVLPLPTDRLRPPHREDTGQRLTVALGTELRAELEHFAQTNQLTVYMVMLAALNVLLARLSRTEDIVIGSPVAGRTQPEHQPLVGFFANTVAIRTRLSGSMTGMELLQQVKHASLSAFEHQDMPFDKLVEVLRPVRSTAYTPIFQVAFNMSPTADVSMTFGAAISTEVPLATESSKFDLTINAAFSEQRAGFDIEFDGALFDKTTIERWMDCYAELLRSLVRNPDQRISRLETMSPGARADLADALSAPITDYPKRSVSQLFEARVASHPDRVALHTFQGAVTYAALNDHANRIAHWLQGQIDPSEALIALSIERSVEAIATTLAILKTGRAYLPIAADEPTTRLNAVLSQCEVRHIVTIGDQPLSEAVRTLSLGEAELSTYSSHNPENACGAEQLAYVMPTSGSTGQPKAVAVPHRGIARLVLENRYVALNELTVTLQSAPLAFDAATFEIWAPLLNGGSCVLYPNEPISAPGLQAQIASHGINTLWLTSSLFNTLTDIDPSCFAGVHTLMTGGERISPAHVARVYATLPDIHIVNCYGPTENTTFTTTYPVPREQNPKHPHGIPIGRPIANTTLHVLDPEGAPVPVGVAGELFIGGDGVALGYYLDEARSAERFIPHAAGDLLYRTGDLVRANNHGVLEFVDRLDTQVKLRGFRIELGEIEACLASHPDVQSCAATVFGGPGQEKLGAVIVPRQVGSASTQLLLEHAAEHLPPYMLPARIVQANALPLNRNGKADLSAISQLLVDAPGDQAASTAPTNDREVDLLHLWRQILDTNDIGIDDGFFDLGGTSLQAVSLMDRIERHYQQRLPLAQIIEHPTVRALAARLAEGYDPESWSPLVPLTPPAAQPPLFFVHAVGGNVHGFVNFSRHLMPERQVYGLQAPGFLGEQPPLDDLAELARLYVRAVRSVQPEGPYHLGGISMGGLIAFEMAQQLTESGDEVAYLLIGDTYFRQGPHLSQMRLATARLGQYAFGLNTFRRLLAGHQHRQAQTHARKPPTFVSKDHEALHDAHTRALERYTPKPWPGRVTLVRATHLTRDQLRYQRACGNECMGWDRLAAGGVQISYLEGNHDTIFYAEDGRPFADVIRKTLDPASEQ